MSVEYPIPVIVRDLLNKLTSSSIDITEKDNIVTTIEEIGRVCSREAAAYRKMRALDYEADRKNKRRGGGRR